MRRAVLIANPAASGFTGGLHRRVVAELGRTYQVTESWPHGAPAARTAAADAAADGVEMVVAMGGDGVVHHVANGLASVDGDTRLGIIPAGTTNVVARILGVPDKPGAAVSTLCTGVSRPLPLAHLASIDADGSRSEYAVFAAGVGFDADMVQVAERRPTSKYHFGSLHYARSAASVLLTEYRTMPANLRVECDGDRIDAVAVLVQVHEPFTYFGRMPLSLGRSAGGLTVAAIESLALRRSLPILLTATRRGDLAGIEGVRLWTDPEKLVVEAEPPSRFQADGEMLGSMDRLEITAVPDRLSVMVPATPPTPSPDRRRRIPEFRLRRRRR